MSRHAATQIAVQVATTELQIPAVMLLLADEPEADRLARLTAVLRAARNDRRGFDQLLVALREGALVGAIWGQLMPGRSALLWPPRTAPGEPQETASVLLAELDLWLQRSEAQLVQAVLRQASELDVQRLVGCGFEHTVDLLYLVSEIRPQRSAPPRGLLRFEAYAAHQRQRMKGLIEATYDGTRDVPGLNGLRDMNNVLEGYEQTGDAQASRWFFVQCDGADAGCLLLADHPDHGQWELVYMGVTPAARGRGWGQVIVEFAQSLAARFECRRLVLAVDADNEPALDIYARAGFTQWDRRTVLLKIQIPGGDRLSRPAN